MEKKLPMFVLILSGIFNGSVISRFDFVHPNSLFSLIFSAFLKNF